MSTASHDKPIGSGPDSTRRAVLQPEVDDLTSSEEEVGVASPRAHRCHHSNQDRAGRAWQQSKHCPTHSSCDNEGCQDVLTTGIYDDEGELDYDETLEAESGVEKVCPLHLCQCMGAYSMTFKADL